MRAHAPRRCKYRAFQNVLKNDFKYICRPEYCRMLRKRLIYAECLVFQSVKGAERDTAETANGWFGGGDKTEAAWVNSIKSFVQLRRR